MKAIKYFILILILTNLFFLVGCETLEEQKAEDEKSQIESEDTGISDVFEDTEEVEPPEIPT